MITATLTGIHITKLRRLVLNMDKWILRIVIVTLYNPDGTGRKLS